MSRRPGSVSICSSQIRTGLAEWTLRRSWHRSAPRAWPRSRVLYVARTPRSAGRPSTRRADGNALVLGGGGGMKRPATADAYSGCVGDSAPAIGAVTSVIGSSTPRAVVWSVDLDMVRPGSRSGEPGSRCICGPPIRGAYPVGDLPSRRGTHHGGYDVGQGRGPRSGDCPDQGRRRLHHQPREFHRATGHLGSSARCRPEAVAAPTGASSCRGG